jgi:hypothetical protein
MSVKYVVIEGILIRDRQSNLEPAQLTNAGPSKALTQENQVSQGKESKSWRTFE